MTTDFAGLDASISRINEPSARFSLLDEMYVERGTKDDWELLHDLHYKAEKLPIGPRFWRLDLHGETIGVLVTGAPKGMLRERHMVFKNLRPKSGDTKYTNTMRYKIINAKFRVISRFVIDTMYRGIGAGYRMMNLVSRLEASEMMGPHSKMPGSSIMEIQSSMSKFNTFGQSAGFRFVKPMNANKYEKVMKFFRSNFNSTPQDYEAILNEVAEMSPAAQEHTLQMCREFYMKNSALENTSNKGENAEKRVARMDMRDVIKGIQQVGLASPLYGYWKCPDEKGSLPDRIPLSAFDLQSPTEKFNG